MFDDFVGSFGSLAGPLRKNISIYLFIQTKINYYAFAFGS